MSTAWQAPWYRLEEDWIARGLEAQLALEVARGHVLDGVRAVAVGRRDDNDDVLFALPDGRVAEVHLTWRKGRETEAHWPATAVFASLDAWIRERMPAAARNA